MKLKPGDILVQKDSNHNDLLQIISVEGDMVKYRWHRVYGSYLNSVPGYTKDIKHIKRNFRHLTKLEKALE